MEVADLTSNSSPGTSLVQLLVQELDTAVEGGPVGNNGVIQGSNGTLGADPLSGGYNAYPLSGAAAAASAAAALNPISGVLSLPAHPRAYILGRTGQPVVHRTGYSVCLLVAAVFSQMTGLQFLASRISVSACIKVPASIKMPASIKLQVSVELQASEIFSKTKVFQARVLLWLSEL